MPQAFRALWLVAGAVIVLAPQLAFVVTAREAWPFTCAPMFAAPLDDVYEPHLVVEKERGEVRFDTMGVEIPEWRFTRLFYLDAVVDGRVDPDRAAAFWRTVVDAARAGRDKHRLPADARAIRVELFEPHRGKKGRGKVAALVGRYDIAAGRWGVE